MRLTSQELHTLIQNKIHKAGLSEDHASVVADVLVYADEKAIHSHGAVRVEYYSERIAKGGITANPKFEFRKTGPCSGIYEGDNGVGFVAAKNAMQEAIDMAKETGIAVVGVRQISHSGAISYYAEMAARENLIGLTMCQSDPMAVPTGGAEPFFGTHPISCAAKASDGRIFLFDMATTVQAWGKVLHARSKGVPIPDDWAVDENGEPTTDAMAVSALLPIAGAKGYGLMFMVDILSGILLGVPSGKNISSMYADLSKGRDLGQLHIVINPEYFCGLESFQNQLATTMDELKASKKAKGVDEIFIPGERGLLKKKAYERDGILIVDDIYNYLISDAVHYDRYDHKNRFAE